MLVELTNLQKFFPFLGLPLCVSDKKRIWFTTLNFCIETMLDSNLYLLQCQVCYYLMVGQVKSVKTVLKQLQQSIQTVTSAGWPSDEEMIPANVADNFQWLTKDHLCILVYLVTVMHSMQVSFSFSSLIMIEHALIRIFIFWNWFSFPLTLLVYLYESGFQ